LRRRDLLDSRIGAAFFVPTAGPFVLFNHHGRT
jgi:hypothetical protein